MLNLTCKRRNHQRTRKKIGVAPYAFCPIIDISDLSNSESFKATPEHTQSLVVIRAQ